jgi:murein DD-endopeptidase MepM/ murein hydrolase activator NlpD
MPWPDNPGMIRPLLTAVLIASLVSPPPAVWTWPVATEKEVVRDFDAPDSEWGPGHRGLDLRASVGTVVVAPVSGRIHFTGDVVNRGVVTIRTASGWLVSMEPVRVDDEVGSRVRAGQRIGRVAPGHCPGGCLHIGLRVEGEYRSPARELGILRRARLLPFTNSGSTADGNYPKGGLASGTTHRLVHRLSHRLSHRAGYARG